ncbi:hypothetical protein ACI3DN_12455 [Sellimonas catena]|uniref:Uncharacterized protein n=1 Tax=Sellimonas catena TaxID=2994035 RepID=A0A9W6C933_9FIRM|nr:hypothetical protein [Sellimonas catena]GLG06168.1 hypothetical protein Selli1_33420 [Sellimonas catena]
MTGTIAGPIITALITNKHQLKLRELDIKQAALDNYEQNRFKAINTFFEKAGRCLSFLDEESIKDFCSVHHCIYQYLPTDFWDELDTFYNAVIAYKWDIAQNLYPLIVRSLSDILKEKPQLNP